MRSGAGRGNLDFDTLTSPGFLSNSTNYEGEKLHFLSPSPNKPYLFTKLSGIKRTIFENPETLMNSANPELEQDGQHYSLNFYCFFEKNPTFAIRN